MRSCAYCGKELMPDEVCSCAQSAAKRAQKQNRETKENVNSRRTTYRAGYTGRQSKIKRAKARYKAKKANRSRKSAGDTRQFFDFIKSFIKSPVDMVINPPDIGKATMLLLAAVQGAVAWLGMFFLYTGAKRSMFAILGKLLGFGGLEGYSSLLKMLMCVLSGAVSGIVLFFMYTGIFWLLNRFILKSKTEYWDFSTRISLIGIPFTVLGAVGVAFGIFSVRTLMLLLICGLIGSVILLYEALRTEWIHRSSSMVMYVMLGGLFILFALILNLIRI